ncbi:MAG: putative toxin-antitoxin system toxin component, PIN family [Methylococcaceae bacterium]|nr:MAG: putative toxin-antitoxin system toxin component, PIN family [Methylococcaceae bacterium]
MKADDIRRVVFDTNALISAAILPDSISRKAFRHALRHYRLVHSHATAGELHTVINRPKFDRYFSAGEREEFLFFIARSSELMWVDTVIDECPDAADNKFLELAVASGSSVIVSGDPHLRDMHPFRNITIATPAEFLSFGV